MSNKNKNIIISGGGTGGHIFPAISIANALKKRNPEFNILFVGAEGKMEMERVPKAGYEIIGLPVMGMPRKLSLKFMQFAWTLLKSLNKAGKIIKSFKPDVAIGVGGYASGPILNAASRKGVPTVLQEQNSYAGVTNKLLANKAKVICVAYEGMGKYFPQDKVVLTGNPVRKEVVEYKGNVKEAKNYFSLDGEKRVVLVLGGSLGARSVNQALLEHVELMNNSDIQWIWQCGKLYYEDYAEKIKGKYANIHLLAFIDRMDYAYAAADLVISRSGAGTISELCLAKKPVILVPSPNVAEDHQTKNALALANKNAALLIKDKEANQSLVKKAIELVNSDFNLKELAENISNMALPDSDEKIVDEILKWISK